MSRSRVRAFRAAGLRIAVEVPGELGWDWPETHAAFVCRPERADVRVGVRVGVPEDALSGRGFVLAERAGSGFARVLRMDPALRCGELVLAPTSVYVRQGTPPLSGMDESLLRHRVAREGRVALSLCVAGSARQALAFGSAHPAFLSACAAALAAARPELLLHGTLVLAPSARGPRLHTTPWTVAGSGAAAPRSVCVGLLHAVRPAPEVLVEPLSGRAAVDALLACAPLQAGDPVGEGMRRAALGLMLGQLRALRLGAPPDARLPRYAFGDRRGVLPTPRPPPEAPSTGLRPS